MEKDIAVLELVVIKKIPTGSWVFALISEFKIYIQISKAIVKSAWGYPWLKSFPNYRQYISRAIVNNVTIPIFNIAYRY